MKNRTIPLIFALLPLLATAQVQPYMVPGDYAIGSQQKPVAREMKSYNGKVIFSSFNELWITDGTSSGTELLYHFSDAITEYPSGFTELNGRIYFAANDSVSGRELWVTDGTAGGTQLVTEIHPGDPGCFNTNSDIIPQFMKFNGKLWFHANDGANGNELWYTDGTAGGTAIFQDAAPGSNNGTFFTSELAVCNNRLLFTANGSDTFITRFYATDGTLQGTTLIKDTVNFGLFNLINFQNRVIFAHKPAGTQSPQVWVTDGTAGNTVQLVSGVLNSKENAILNNELYFFASDDLLFGKFTLYKTDGTPGGTYPITDSLGYINQISVGSSFSPITYNNHIYFGAYKQNKSALWRTDGTTAGTIRLLDTIPQFPMVNFGPYATTHFNDRIYFRSWDSTRFNLWYTDGTVSGTGRVEMPGANHTETTSPFTQRCYLAAKQVSTGNALYYLAHYSTTAGQRIYKLDLFPAGIEKTSAPIAIDIYPNPSQGYINIDAADAKSISIHSINGSAVYQSGHLSGQRTHSADVRHLSVGTYTVTTQLTNGTTRFGKFVKQ
ncbi:MAG: T9SS type A sorting domain-containing protein [Flavipsychrobacter sp.]|nr:T9SS type A sorting domain-containing protein [Flavipsychrobacter sp.]